MAEDLLSSSYSFLPTLSIPFAWEQHPGLSNLIAHPHAELPPPLYPLPPPPRLHYATPPSFQRSLSSKLQAFFTTLLPPHTSTHIIVSHNKLPHVAAKDDSAAHLSAGEFVDWITSDDEAITDFSSSITSAENSSEEWSRSTSSSSSSCASRRARKQHFVKWPDVSLKDQWRRIRSRRYHLGALSAMSPFRWQRHLTARSSHTSTPSSQLLDHKFACASQACKPLLSIHES